LDRLARYIAKTMPEDEPGKLKLPDAEKVAAFIFDAFYSPDAQAKLKPPPHRPGPPHRPPSIATPSPT